MRRPLVRDWAKGPAEGKVRFTSAILPRWARRSHSLDALLPILYLRGILTGDFQEALSALLGESAPNLSPGDCQVGKPMPGAFRFEGFRFYFLNGEGDSCELVHIHIAKAGAEAKFWLHPDALLAYNRSFDARTIRRLGKIVETHTHQIEEAWNEHFG